METSSTTFDELRQSLNISLDEIAPRATDNDSNHPSSSSDDEERVTVVKKKTSKLCIYKPFVFKGKKLMVLPKSTPYKITKDDEFFKYHVAYHSTMEIKARNKATKKYSRSLGDQCEQQLLEKVWGVSFNKDGEINTDDFVALDLSRCTFGTFCDFLLDNKCPVPFIIGASSIRFSRAIIVLRDLLSTSTQSFMETKLTDIVNIDLESFKGHKKLFLEYTCHLINLLNSLVTA